ncbi:MAG: hypothetical protein L7S56_02165 [Candidatus Poseidonia sp.]|nr:hypothetical protein [Poseidonia sp.]
MFDSWGATEWFILVIDLVALAIVVEFLRRKIKHKLDEVEVRQAFHLQQRRAAPPTTIDETSDE